MSEAMEKIKGEFGDVGCAAAIFNASGAFSRKPFLEIGEEAFGKAYDVSV